MESQVALMRALAASVPAAMLFAGALALFLRGKALPRSCSSRSTPRRRPSGRRSPSPRLARTVSRGRAWERAPHRIGADTERVAEIWRRWVDLHAEPLSRPIDAPKGVD